MAIERRLGLVSPVLFTSNGTAGGLVTVSSTKGFVVKAKVVLTANTLPTLQLEVKRVLSKTQFLVGEKGKIEQRANISLYTTALNATIYQPEQDRPGIILEQHERAVYEEEPAMAKRVIIVDSFGDKYDESNPFHVTNKEDSSGLIVDQASATIIYLGEGLFGALTSQAKWKIKKIDTSVGVRITLASTEFDQIWDNRAALTYV